MNKSYKFREFFGSTVQSAIEICKRDNRTLAVKYVLIAEEIPVFPFGIWVKFLAKSCGPGSIPKNSKSQQTHCCRGTAETAGTIGSCP